MAFCLHNWYFLLLLNMCRGSKTPGNAQNSRDVSLMRNKKRVSTYNIYFFIDCVKKNIFFFYWDYICLMKSQPIYVIFYVIKRTKRLLFEHWRSENPYMNNCVFILYLCNDALTPGCTQRCLYGFNCIYHRKSP